MNTLQENIECWVFNRVDLFAQLSFDHKYMMHNAIKGKKFKKNEVVVKEGALLNHVFIIKTGRVKVIQETNDKENIKHILKEGEVFGELGVIDSSTYSHFNDTVKVMDNDTVIYAIPNSVMKKICSEDESLYSRLALYAISKLRKLDERLSSVTLKNSKERVIDFLKEMANEIGKPIGYEMLLKHNLTHQEIANLIGISRQKVTTILNELRQEGLIYMERNVILIHEVSLLK